MKNEIEAKQEIHQMSVIGKIKTIAISQSNYIPWKGYFDIISSVDEFIIFDEAQFTRRDWRNRNKIIIDGQLHWLTIPVKSKGNFDISIKDVEISDRNWAEKHWRSIKNAYSKAEYFNIYANYLEDLYENAKYIDLLSDVNEIFMNRILKFLELETPIFQSHHIPRLADNPTDRLIEICKGRGANAYLSGPAARGYLVEAAFDDAGISLHYADYSGYPTYAQMSHEFEHGVSIIDTLMRCGPTTRTHLKSIDNARGLFAKDRVSPGPA